MKLIHISYSGPIYSIRQGRYCFFFELHRYLGPMRVDPKGDPENDGIFPDRSPFWEMFQNWIDGGRKLDGDKCMISTDET